MQVVFVHGVNTRYASDRERMKVLAARDDRLRRLAFGDGATIRSPYWGQYGLAGKVLASVPKLRGAAEALGSNLGHVERTGILEAAEKDFPATVAAMSIEAITEASLNSDDAARRRIEDYWMAAAAYAEMQRKPSWLADTATEEEFVVRLSAEVKIIGQMQGLGSGWLPELPKIDLNDFAAEQARRHASGFLAQFLGDALMFFARRDKSVEVRREVTDVIVAAAGAAKTHAEPLVLIGHSMGGSVLQEVLSDSTEVSAIEDRLGHRLEVDLFLSVGTQIGLFSELNLFPTLNAGGPLAIPVKHYWNVYDYTDALAFLCGPSIAAAIDFEVNTAAGVVGSHSAYFENALFFQRLKTRLMDVGLLP